jgi:hypothetical protein
MAIPQRLVGARNEKVEIAVVIVVERNRKCVEPDSEINGELWVIVFQPFQVLARRQRDRQQYGHDGNGQTENG